MTKCPATFGTTEILLDHPDSLRTEQPRAQSLHEARKVEPGGVGGQAGRDRRGGANGCSNEEKAPATHDVARTPGTDKNHAARPCVTRHHPSAHGLVIRAERQSVVMGRS